MTTYAAFAAAISGLTISGVERQYTFRPPSLDLANGPASYVELPLGDATDLPTLCTGVGKQRSINLIVAVESLGQGNPEPNYDATVAMMDNVESALDSYKLTSAMNPHVEYTIATSGDTPITVGEVSFWAVIATVTIIDY